MTYLSHGGIVTDLPFHGGLVFFAGDYDAFLLVYYNALNYIGYSQPCFLLYLLPKVLISLAPNNFKDTSQKTNQNYLEQKILL